MDFPISTILDVIKDPDLKIKISQLVSENLQLKEENFKLKKKLEDQKKQEETSNSLIHENNHYYVKTDTSRAEPFCTNCWDSNRKLINLHKGNFANGLQYYKCPSCNTDTSIGQYVPQQRRSMSIDY
jgi:regulator of replication initiation timing